jgi:hypothetical protein
MGESRPEALPVEVHVLYFVAAGDHPCGSAAGKDGLGDKIGGLYRIRLEEAHRQEGDLLQPGNAGGTDAQSVGVSAVEGVVLVLGSKKFEGPGLEIRWAEAVK